MASEFYNSRRRYKKKRRGAYKPRSSMRRSVITKVFVSIIALGVLSIGIIFLLPTISGGRISLFDREEPTPTPSPEPQATAHPIDAVEDISDLVRSIAMTDSAFQWFADSFSYNSELMFCGGEVVNGDAYMTALFTVSTKKDAVMTARRINLLLEYDHIMYPRFNDDWIVYLDAKANGGGEIKCCKRNDDLSKSVTVKTVYTEHPALFLSGDFLAWTERTGTSMDKLYICDLTTMESATVQTFNKAAYYGVSKPHLMGEQLIYADVDTENSTGSITSQICSLNVNSGEFLSYKPGMFAHDPKSNGKEYIAWLTGNHGIETDLYIAKDMGEPVLVAKSVFDFYMDEYYLAYQKDEMIFVYILTTGKEYKLSKNGQCAQLLGASGGCVVWSDVTSRDRETLEYAIIPN